MQIDFDLPQSFWAFFVSVWIRHVSYWWRKLAGRIFQHVAQLVSLTHLYGTKCSSTCSLKHHKTVLFHPVSSCFIVDMFVAHGDSFSLLNHVLILLHQQIVRVLCCMHNLNDSSQPKMETSTIQSQSYSSDLFIRGEHEWKGQLSLGLLRFFGAATVQRLLDLSMISCRHQ